MNRSSATKLLSALALLALVALARAQQTGAPTQTLLIDYSASMEGFFYKEAGSDQNWMQWLQASISEGRPELQTLYFVNQEITATPANFGGNTYINNAFEKVTGGGKSPSILWFVTDNQPSGGGPADEDLENFYRNLQTDKVKRIHIFPLRFPYTGRIFLRDASRREYSDDAYNVVGEVKGPHAGKHRGLVLYALLLSDDEAAAKVYADAVADFEASYNERLRVLDPPMSTNAIRAKPLERDFAVLRGIQRGENLHQDAQSGDVVNIEDYGVEQQIRGSFIVELASKNGEIEISKANIKVDDNGGSFKSGDFSDANVAPHVTPEVIENFTAQNTKELKISIDMEPVSWQWWNPVSVIRTIRDERGYIEGQIRLRIEVPRQNFRLADELGRISVGNEIFSDVSPDVQGRVYNLGGLIDKMIPQQDTINVQPEVEGGSERVIPVRIAVAYPAKSVWFYGLLLLALAVAVGFLIMWFKRRPFYRLTWDNRTALACNDFRLWPFVSQPVEIDGRTGASIRKTLSGIKVNAASGYKVDDAASKYVSPTGTDFSLRRNDDGAGLTFYFSKASAGRDASRKPGSGSAEITYGQSPDADSTGPSNGRPPLRRPTTGARAVAGEQRGASRPTSSSSSSSSPGPVSAPDSGGSGSDDDW